MTRFPLAPLLVAANRPTHATVAEVMGVKTTTVHQWVQRGLSTHMADRLAVAFGLHPAEVWDGWWSPELVAPPKPRADRRVKDRAYYERNRDAIQARARARRARKPCTPQDEGASVAA